jgi:hypothetical protein
MTRRRFSSKLGEDPLRTVETYSRTDTHTDTQKLDTL